MTFTTRPRRDGEIDGVDHYFVSDEEFKRILDAGELAEWASVFGHYCGTPRKPLETAIAAGRDMLGEIDIEGARQIRGHYGRDAVTIFILPPSFGDLEIRLRGRGTEDASAVETRLRRAKEEAATFGEYDYLIINANLAESLAQLASIVEAERLRVSRLPEGQVPWKS